MRAVLVALSAVLAATPALPQGGAAPPEVPLAVDLPDGIPDIGRGERIVTRGMGCGVADAECTACFICHDREGSGSPSMPVPRVAGQSYLYLYAELLDFATGRRESFVMSPIAHGLSPEAMRDVAAFYALADPEYEYEAAAAARTSDFDPETIEAGRELATRGSDDIMACVSCHGPEGIGAPPFYPYLAGQYRQYLVKRLKAFRTAEGVDSPERIMHRVADDLSDRQIEQLATYFAAQRPVEHPPQELVPGLDEVDPDQEQPAGETEGRNTPEAATLPPK